MSKAIGERLASVVVTRRAPTPFEWIVISAVGVIGFCWASGSLSDNSFFVHLRTGIDIFNSGHIPHSDPYSFTAAGRSWVVQSWLAEWTYGFLYHLGGGHLVIVEQMVLVGLIAAGTTWLARTGALIGTLFGALIIVLLSAAAVATRPYLFGYMAFVVVVAVTEHRRPHTHWILVPTGWIWVNSHGSFPFGVLWLLLVMAGVALDRGRVDRWLVRCTATLLLGTLLGAVSPVGYQLLLFPLRIIWNHSPVFDGIVEWESPNFHDLAGLVLLGGFVLLLVGMSRWRLKWSDALPVTVFMVFSLYAQRNLAFLSIALAPVLGRSLDTGVVRAGDRGARMRSFEWTALGFLVCVSLAKLVYIENQPTFNQSSYPQAALNWLDQQGLSTAQHRMAARDFVGCYRILRDGRNANVFVDDRYDMYPASVAKDSLTLLRAQPGAREVLDKWNVDLVLWERSGSLTEDLRSDPHWRSVYEDRKWVVFQRVQGSA